MHAEELEAADRIARLVAGAPRPLALRTRVQPYAWGGPTYLRELTRLSLPPGEPAAEWWVGAHPIAPSVVVSEAGECPLDRLIAHAPDVLLGPAVARRFGRLPFLLKVLDVRQMLSIQAHPSKSQAEAGFAREQAEAVPLDAPTRTYKDDNHKPEAQVALTPFWLLCGFRPPADIDATLSARPELAPLARQLGSAPPGADASALVRALYEHVMTLPQDAVDVLLAPLVARLAPAYRADSLPRDSPDFWAARAAEQFPLPGGRFDRGILSIYFMNLVQLAPGEGTFLGAGLLHAYLEGIAVEVMASSDNVIRGGLTPKHMDVAELLRVLAFEPTAPRFLVTERRRTSERRYSTPATEFALRRLDLAAGERLVQAPAGGPELSIVLEGSVDLTWTGGSLALSRGAAVFAPAGLACELAAGRAALVFQAFVP